MDDVSIYQENIHQLKEMMKQQSILYEQSIKNKISSFNSQDKRQFELYLNQLQDEFNDKINQYFISQYEQKESSYNLQIVGFKKNFDDLMQKMQELQEDLSDGYEALKKKDVYKNILQQHMLEYFWNQRKRTQVFRVLKQYYLRKKGFKQRIEQCRQIYVDKLRKSCYQSWRRIAYKGSYDKTLSIKYGQDIRKISNEYLSIIQTLKQKIAQTEEMIKIKKLAKSEFAYSLSRNMLKTISNLSMEVMSLNQVTLKDHKIDGTDTVKFLDDINVLVQEKFREIEKRKETIRDEVQQSIQQQEQLNATQLTTMNQNMTNISANQMIKQQKKINFDSQLQDNYA